MSYLAVDWSKKRLATRDGNTKRRAEKAATGLSQLTLVEHALCPVDSRAGLVENLVFHAKYPFKTTEGLWRRAKVRVNCPNGLCATDEMILWGLLALTLRQTEPTAELLATPYYCLRQLGLINGRSRRGGRQYQDFRSTVERLSLVTYQNNNFYDPVRSEHRSVGFGFLSYSLPQNLKSSRVWRIHWNNLFFEMVNACGGHCWFDLETYRVLDLASRRLFLLIAKIFSRRTTTPKFDMADLATNVLGYSPSLRIPEQKVRVLRSVARLAEMGIIQSVEEKTLFEKHKKGRYAFRLAKGPYFDRMKVKHASRHLRDSPLYDPLHDIGLDDATIGRLLKEHPGSLLQEWADITLAARERFGNSFFRRSTSAYFVHNVQKAAKDGRTPPDWWHDVRKEESRREAAIHRRRREREMRTDTPQQAGDMLAQVMEQVFTVRTDAENGTIASRKSN